MYPHRIRLRGPWQVEPMALGVRCRRRFGYPGRIDAYERVWLTFDGVAGSCEVWLNGKFLGHRALPDCTFEFEVQDFLQVRNELVVQMEVPKGQGALWQEVALEVRCTAFLRAVHAVARIEDGTTTLLVTGEVVGTAERPLELYVLVDGATQHYAVVEPTPEGTPFNVTLHDPSIAKRQANLPDGKHIVRVDLVNGAVLWYAVERLVAIEEKSSD